MPESRALISLKGRKGECANAVVGASTGTAGGKAGVIVGLDLTEDER